LKRAPHQAAPVVETTAVPFLRELLLVSWEPALLSPQDEPQAPCSQVRQQAPGEPRFPSAQVAPQQVPQVLCAGQPAAL
jgi:hypothetical protein